MGQQRILFIVAGLAVPALVMWGWRAMSGPDDVNLAAIEGQETPAQLAATSSAGSCNPDAVLVDFELEMLLFGGDTTSVRALDPMCSGDYELAIVSGDRNHRAGFQTEQTDERVVVEFVDGAGSALVTSSSTTDLAEDRTIGISTQTIELIPGITGVRVRHAGRPGAVNSIIAVGIALVPKSTDVECDNSTATIYFDGSALTAGQQDRRTIDTFETCLCLEQTVVAVSQDLQHRQGYQTGQTNEQWTVTAADAEGDRLGQTESTADLADDRWASLDLLSMESDLESGPITFTAANTAAVGPNSIDPVAVVIAAH